MTSINSTQHDSPVVFTALDFLGVFFSILKRKNINIISSEKLFQSLGKHRNEYPNLFIDIDVVNSGETTYSQDLEEAISMLEISGMIEKISPRYEKIILKMCKKDAEDCISDCSKSHLKQIEGFTNGFLNTVA